MLFEDQEELKRAYNAVFDKKGQVKNCGRDACSNLIRMMRPYTSEDIGDESTGTLNVDLVKLEYYRIIVL